MYIFRKNRIDKINKELNIMSGLQTVLKRSNGIPSMRFNFIISDGEPTIYHHVVDDLANVCIDYQTFQNMITVYESHLSNVLNNLKGGE